MLVAGQPLRYGRGTPAQSNGGGQWMPSYDLIPARGTVGEARSQTHISPLHWVIFKLPVASREMFASMYFFTSPSRRWRSSIPRRMARQALWTVLPGLDAIAPLSDAPTPHPVADPKTTPKTGAFQAVWNLLRRIGIYLDYERCKAIFFHCGLDPEHHSRVNQIGW